MGRNKYAHLAPKKRHWRAVQCATKKKHTEASATKAIEKQAEKGRTLRAYYCGKCDAYHLTSNVKGPL